MLQKENRKDDTNPRWKRFSKDEILKRDKSSLDITWLKAADDTPDYSLPEILDLIKRGSCIVDKATNNLNFLLNKNDKEIVDIENNSEIPLIQLIKLAKQKTLQELLTNDEWEMVKLGEVCEHNAGKTLDKGRNTGTLREYITTSNLYWDSFDFTEIRKMLIEDKELERCTALKGDLLVCEGGDAGRSAIWKSNEPICFQNHIHRVRPKDKK